MKGRRIALLALAALVVAGADPAPAPSDPAAALAPGAIFRDCTDCPEMVVIPEGAFEMGSIGAAGNEQPQHPVTIGRRFALGRYPVTRREFALFVRHSGYRAEADWRDAGFTQSDRDPVVEMGWLDAEAYAHWLSTVTHQAYRLPSEAEWEYAARAQRATQFWWGDDESAAPAFANAKGVDDGFANTAPVGSFQANRFGLFDMAGNVWQWTADCYNKSYADAPADGAPWLTGDCTSRVVRGGSWYDPRSALRVTNRVGNHIVDHDDNVGFRIARTIGP